MERRRSSLDQCGNKQDHIPYICVHARAHGQRACTLPKPCRMLKSRGKKGFGNAREKLLGYYSALDSRWFAQMQQTYAVGGSSQNTSYFVSASANAWSSQSSSIKMCLVPARCALHASSRGSQKN